MRFSLVLRGRDAMVAAARPWLDAEAAKELANNVAMALADGVESVDEAAEKAVRRRIAQGWLVLEDGDAPFLIDALTAAWRRVTSAGSRRPR